MKAVIAIDLGASSGRVMVGYLADNNLTLEEFHRFSNQQVMRDGASCWDLDAIMRHIKLGIDKVVATGLKVSSLGIDSWGVDFVLLDAQGQALGEFVSYRDNRTEGRLAQLLADSGLSKQEIYSKTGIQFLPFNSLYQLKAITEQQPDWFAHISRLLFIPDYLNYRLCGVQHCEYTNASTSQLLDCREQRWDHTLIEACGAKPEWFLPVSMPNRIIGEYQHGSDTIPVCSVASHDTASAVAATPINHHSMAYLSSGTWSLLGIESEQPFTNDLAYQYNITNEGGGDGRYRVLKNIMGLWLIQGLRAENSDKSFGELAELARHVEPFKFVVNPNDNDFLNPSSMSAAIDGWFIQRGQPAPQSLAERVRCVYDSLALAYDNSLSQLAEVTGRSLSHLRIVGGGTQDHFLNQLCADVCQLDVTTEPAEASALGNVVNQFIACGAIRDIEQARQIIDASSCAKQFTPQPIVGLAQFKQRFKQLLN